MKLKRLFLSLSQEEKDKVSAAIIEAGLCTAVGTISFRDYLKPAMLSMHGDSRLFIKLFRRIDPARQNRFYDAMTSYELPTGEDDDQN